MSTRHEMSERRLLLEVLDVLDDLTIMMTRLDRRIRAIARVEQGELEMASKNQEILDQIRARAQANTDALASVKATIDALRQAVADNATDPAALQAVLDAINTESTTIASMTLENTKAAPNAPAGGA